MLILYSIKDGRVAESGSHDELIKRGDLYYEMWQKQLHDDDDDTNEQPINGDATPFQTSEASPIASTQPVPPIDTSTRLPETDKANMVSSPTEMNEQESAKPQEDEEEEEEEEEESSAAAAAANTAASSQQKSKKKKRRSRSKKGTTF